MPIFLFGLLEARLFGVVFIVGTVRIIIVSGAGIAFAGLGAALAMPMLCFLLGGLASIASSPLVSFGVSTIYISYEEVAVHFPVSGGPCMSHASSSIPSMSLKSKSSTSAKSSIMVTKWVVGGQQIPSSPASHSRRT